MMKLFLFVMFALLFVACASTPEKTPPAPLPTVSESRESTIDLVALQTHLQLDRRPDELGYAERAFNTCQVGYGYSSVHNCRQQYFVVLNFRLSCRNSEGTVSYGLEESDLRPIADKGVRWNLKGLSGTAPTDGEGYGQIHVISDRSQKRERVKLAVGNDFLYMRANEVTRIVTPGSWCQ